MDPTTALTPIPDCPASGTTQDSRHGAEAAPPGPDYHPPCTQRALLPLHSSKTNQTAPRKGVQDMLSVPRRREANILHSAMVAGPLPGAARWILRTPHISVGSRQEVWEAAARTHGSAPELLVRQMCHQDPPATRSARIGRSTPIADSSAGGLQGPGPVEIHYEAYGAPWHAKVNRGSRH